MVIALNLLITFGNIAIFTMLIFHEHGRSFYLLIASSISFFKDLKFLLYRSFPCSVRVTPRQFMLFVAIVKGDVSLISLSTYLLSVYGRATDFFQLILYPATLLKVFTSYKSFLVEFLESLIYTIISSANSKSLISCFPICILLISFYCLIALVRTSSTILNRFGENDSLVLFLMSMG